MSALRATHQPSQGCDSRVWNFVLRFDFPLVLLTCLCLNGVKPKPIFHLRPPLLHVSFHGITSLCHQLPETGHREDVLKPPLLTSL